MELDIIILCSDPKMALPFIFIFVSFSSYITYLFQRDISKQNQILYWKTASFIAELCVIIGLVGIVSFAGRAKIIETQQHNLQEIQVREIDLSRSFNEAYAKYCNPLRMFPALKGKYLAAEQLCVVVNNYSAIHKKDIDWDQAEEDFVRLEKKYPEEHEVLSLSSQISENIKKMRRAKGNASVATQQFDLILKSISWKFIISAVGIVALGVSIKCARVFAEFINEPKIKDVILACCNNIRSLVKCFTRRTRPPV